MDLTLHSQDIHSVNSVSLQVDSEHPVQDEENVRDTRYKDEGEQSEIVLNNRRPVSKKGKKIKKSNILKRVDSRFDKFSNDKPTPYVPPVDNNTKIRLDLKRSVTLKKQETGH